METMDGKKQHDQFITKAIFVGVIAIVMAIPLWMVRNVISEREKLLDESVRDIQSSWAESQCLTGPMLRYTVTESIEDMDGEPKKQVKTKRLYPTLLQYQVCANTETLHRSIYDVTVYTSDVVVKGNFSLSDELLVGGTAQLRLALTDLRGIVGNVYAQVGDKQYEFVAENMSSDNSRSGVSSVDEGKAIITTIELPTLTADSSRVVPYEIKMKVRGSEAIYFRPVGNLTEIEMTGNCTTPSFLGDFLPNEREVDDKGFCAKWVVTQINRGAPESSKFGVKMLQPVTQYQQTTRAAKYGMLIIVLVFLAGFCVEWVTKKEINLLQYIVIGCSLVLFYMLLLSFSEFMPFWLSFLLAAMMTTIALTGYYRGILKTKIAYYMGGFVALAYAASYIMMQMETYAMLGGSLLLFICLCGVMFFTSNGVLSVDSAEVSKKSEEEA